MECALSLHSGLRGTMFIGRLNVHKGLECACKVGLASALTMEIACLSWPDGSRKMVPCGEDHELQRWPTSKCMNIKVIILSH